MKNVNISEAAKILGVNKKTLMRWDEAGIFPAERESVSKIRIYDKALVEKAARWLNLRKREKEHLKKLPAINKRRSKFIPITPLDPLVDPKPQNFDEMKKAYKEFNDWKKKYDELQKEYAEFTEDFYGGLEK